MTQPRNPRQAKGVAGRRAKVIKRMKAARPPCWLCGYPIDYDAHHMARTAFVCDEVVPVRDGGSPCDPDNMRPAHRCCNGWRGAKKPTRTLLSQIRRRFEREVLHATKRRENATQRARAHDTSREW